REALEEARKKVHFLTRFFSLAAYAAPLRWGRFIAVSGQKFFGVLSTFFPKKVLSGVRGSAPYSFS
ncbi:MAG: hypothetical protein ACI3YE_06550, partial [Candidatus Avispirillum sp.]